MRTTHLAVAFVLASLCHVAPAPAQDVDPRGQAQDLFKKGRKLLEAGRLDEACPALEESLRLDAVLVTRMNLAACYEATGRAASALREFAAAAEAARREGNASLAGVAEDHARTISEKTHRLSIEQRSRKPGQTLSLDGKTLGDQDLAKPIPVDPGPHVLEAHASGHRPWRKMLAVEGQPRVIVEGVPPLEPEPAIAPPSTEQRGSKTVPAFVAGGVAVVGIGLGTYFGLRTFDKRDESKPECSPNGECSQTGLDLQTDAREAALVSTIAFGVGIVAAGACVYFLVTGGSSRAKTAITPAGLRF